MGLTIHYELNSEQVKQTVYQMRQLALDLPFEEVGEIIDLTGDQCNYEARRSELQNGDEKNESLFLALDPGGEERTLPLEQAL